MMKEKVLALLKDNDFITELKKATGIEDVLKLLASKGADVTADELKALFADFKEKALSGEISDEELSAAAGGDVIFDPLARGAARGLKYLLDGIFGDKIRLTNCEELEPGEYREVRVLR